MMLIAGAIDFVIFVERRNEYASGGGLRRLVTSVREVNGVDGRVLSSEIFAEGARRDRRTRRADPVHRRAPRRRLPSRMNHPTSRQVVRSRHAPCPTSC